MFENFNGVCIVDFFPSPISPYFFFSPLQRTRAALGHRQKVINSASLIITIPSLTKYVIELIGRFPFDQKFRKFRVGERMEQTFSGISFRNFGCTSRGWPKIPENRNNRKILFHWTIPTRASFSEPGNRTTWRELLVERVCQLLEHALG